jgi:hypothetical protein
MPTEKTSQENSIDKLMESLDRFLDDRHIFSVNVDNNLEDLLDVDRDALKTMSFEECGENAVLLAKYAYYIQRLVNKETAAIHLIEASLDSIVGKYFGSYKGSKWVSKDEVRLRIISDNDAAKEYNRLRVLAQARIDELSYLANRVQFMSQTFLDLQQSKRAATFRGKN